MYMRQKTAKVPGHCCIYLFINISYKALRPHDGTEIFEGFTFAQRSITDLTQYSTDRSHIGYSRVEEKVSGGGTTAYAFTDFESYPDMDAGDTGLSYYIEVTENAFVDKLMDLRACPRTAGEAGFSG